MGPGECSQSSNDGFSQDSSSSCGAPFDVAVPNNNAFGGIEATDLSSLLEQFESASALENIDVFSLADMQTTDTSSSKQNETHETPASSQGSKVVQPSSAPRGLSEAALEKIRAARKQKAAIMLPLVMPAKRGRGQAVAIPPTCAPRTLQRIMMQKASNQALLGINQCPPQTTKAAAAANEKPCTSDVNNSNEEGCDSSVKEQEKFEVNSDYYDQILDHDYCSNSPRCGISELDHESSEATSTNFSELGAQKTDERELKMQESSELEEGELVDDDDEVANCPPYPSVRHRTNTSNRGMRGSVRKSWSKRVYRKKESSPPPDSGEYYDKIPSYYTALSIPAIKTGKDSGLISNSGIHMKDFMERDPSPTRETGSLYSKVPDYFSSFTKSQKYDPSVTVKEDPLAIDFSDNSPDYNVDLSRSRSRSFSRSRSRSLSRSRSYSSSRSRSRSSSSTRGRCRKRKRSSSSRSSRYSSSSSSSSSSGFSRSRSRSYSRSYSRSRSRSPHRSWREKHPRNRSRRRYRSRSVSSERYRQERKKRRLKERQKQLEERRIIYVGRIPNEYTKGDLRRRFERFGEIEHVSVHFREHGDNYGFVTFAYTCDAHAAKEKGNDIPGEKKFDLCFGGRRQFCKDDYADLDGLKQVEEESYASGGRALNFDDLLKQAKANLRK